MGLFGSVAIGTQREDSDVDILVEFDEPIGLRFMDFADQLERVLGKRVDILTPAGVDSIRHKSIADSIRKSVINVYPT